MTNPVLSFGDVITLYISQEDNIYTALSDHLHWCEPPNVQHINTLIWWESHYIFCCWVVWAYIDFLNFRGLHLIWLLFTIFHSTCIWIPNCSTVTRYQSGNKSNNVSHTRRCPSWLCLGFDSWTGIRSSPSVLQTVLDPSPWLCLIRLISLSSPK